MDGNVRDGTQGFYLSGEDHITWSGWISLRSVFANSHMFFARVA
jgi:hypothetical protein